MTRRPAFLFIIPCALVLSSALSCGGARTGNAPVELRPLEENKALDIAGSVLAEKGYQVYLNQTVTLSNGTTFSCDLRVAGKGIAIEYITAVDASQTGPIPPPAEGSRLHVIPATILPPPEQLQVDPATPAENAYIFILNEDNYPYHFNPTPETRSEVTYLEVENRLRRDLKDFLAWYENLPE